MKTGNSGRSPLFPTNDEDMPYILDFKGCLERNRRMKRRDMEVYHHYRLLFSEGYQHPQRELTNSIIYDAEYRAEIFKRIEEQRHQTALLCVQLGLYKDSYEAKQGVRGKLPWIDSFFRQNDQVLRLQIQAPPLQIVIYSIVIY
jgi:hypothetical protein